MATRHAHKSLCSCAFAVALTAVILCVVTAPACAGTGSVDVSLNVASAAKTFRVASLQPLGLTTPRTRFGAPTRPRQTGLGASSLSTAVPFPPYRRLKGIHVFRGGPAAITDGFGSILTGLGYVGSWRPVSWIVRPDASQGLPVTETMGTILTALGYGASGGIEMEWTALYPVTRSMGVMLAGLGYEPRGASNRGAVRTATSNPPLTRSMATILTGLGYGRHSRTAAASVARRHARVR